MLLDVLADHRGHLLLAGVSEEFCKLSEFDCALAVAVVVVGQEPLEGLVFVCLCVCVFVCLCVWCLVFDVCVFLVYLFVYYHTRAHTRTHIRGEGK